MRYIVFASLFTVVILFILSNFVGSIFAGIIGDSKLPPAYSTEESENTSLPANEGSQETKLTGEAATRYEGQAESQWTPVCGTYQTNVNLNEAPPLPPISPNEQSQTIGGIGTPQQREPNVEEPKTFVPIVPDEPIRAIETPEAQGSPEGMQQEENKRIGQEEAEREEAMFREQAQQEMTVQSREISEREAFEQQQQAEQFNVQQEEAERR